MAENLIRLDQLVDLNKYSESLGPLKDFISHLNTKVFIADLESDVSAFKDEANYSFKLVTFDRLDIVFGGTGLALVLNPGSGSSSTRTEFPISLSWSWGILAYMEKFDLTSFTFSPSEVYNLILEMFSVDDDEVLDSLIYRQYNWTDVPHGDEDPPLTGTIDTRHPIEKFIDDFNTNYTPATPIVYPTSTTVDVLADVAEQMITNGNTFVIKDIIFNDFVSGATDDDTFNNFRWFMAPFFPNFTLERFKEIVTPYLAIALESLSIALEFPRTWLQPIDPNTGEVYVSTSVKSQLTFNVGGFYLSTRSGFEFKNESAFNFGKSIILNSGFTLEFTNVKLDLDEGKNIEEATAEGRPDTFKGVYVESAVIGLPKGWVEDGAQTASLKGENMLIGSEGGFSGEISLDGGPLLTKMGEIQLKLEALDFVFLQNTVDNFSATAKVRFPGMEDSGGSPEWITITMGYSGGLYTVTGSNLPRINLFGFGFEINSISFEFNSSGIQNFSVQADIYIDGITDSGGSEVAIPITISKSGNILTAGLSSGASLPPLKIFGIELVIDSVAFSINLDTGALTGFNIGGKVKIEQLKQPGSSDPAEIGIEITYATTPARKFSVDVDGTGLPPAKIGDFAVGLTSFGFEFVNGSFSNFDLSGTIAHPELVNATSGTPEPLTFTTGYVHTPNPLFTLSVGAPSNGITIKGLPFAFTGFSITFSDTTLNAISFSGIITIDAIKDKNTGNAAQIGVTFEYDDGDLRIAGTAAGVILLVENVLEFQPTGIEFGTESGDWFFGLTGSLTRLFDVPVVGKFLPSKVTADEFLIKQGDSPEFDLSFEWEDGVEVSGTDEGGLEFIIPIDKTFFGSLTLGGIGLKLTPGTPDGLETEIRLYNATLELGPFTGTVDGIGMELDVSFPSSGGNLGPVDVGIGFIPPTGIGFVLDAGAVKGGGFLSFDHDAGRYAGALELDFSGLFGFTAVGIVTTKMPDGSKGFSLLLLVNVTFGTPIALGFNFYLAGIGGLIGLHRTMDTEAIRLGVKDGSISNILFPENVIANISKIISDMEAIFPVKRDQFFLGLMARITWNTPALLTIEAGLAIEFPSPVRIAILGVIRCALPTADKAILKLNVAFAGIIDFEKKLLSFDASIFDSRILTITLEGDMALRISWGSKPDFLISVGGFHPSYTPPAHLELLPMKRLTVNILSGNPNLVLTAYFALTSNTIQFGAAIDFSFKISKFGIYGYFGFDVLIQFSPFRFIAGIKAGVAVKIGKTTIMSISLSFNLEGPAPWRAHGHAKFKILFFSIKVKFDKTWGEKKENSLPATDVLPLLLEEMNKDENWDAKPGTQAAELVTLAQGASAPGIVIVRPFGSLEFKQEVVPLDLTMEKFGNYQPGDITRATFSKVTVNGTDFTGNDLGDLKSNFAPSAYKEMSDADKLKAPSYEDQNAGVRLETTDDIKFDYGINRLVEYETILSDEEEEELGLLSVSTDFFRPFVKGGAIGKSALSVAKKKKLKKTSVKVNLQTEEFAVANINDMSNAVAGGVTFESKAAADEYLRSAVASDPSLEGSLQLTPAYQLA